ncbi:ATP-binding cassette domain-containing protein, partial [Megamonas funiformis]
MALEVAIKKYYPDFSLDVNFYTEKGILGVLGASGCGKSMTLKCIAGIETPDEGKIILNGRVLFDSEKKINLSPQKRNIGYLFQNYALFPHMNVEENIAVGIKIKEEKNEIIAKYLKIFHLENLKKAYPKNLSGGQ